MLTYIVHRYLTPKCTYKQFCPFSLFSPRTPSITLVFLSVAVTHTSAKISNTFFILSGRDKSVVFSKCTVP